MKYLCYLFLVTAVHGYGTGRLRRETNVPAPHIRRIIVKDDSGFLVQWDPVKSDGEPVLGYKLKVKEINEDVSQLNTSKNSEKNGDKNLDRLVKEINEHVNLLNTSKNSEKNGDEDLDTLVSAALKFMMMMINEILKSEIDDIDIKGADNTEAVFNSAKLDTWYEFRVVAYTKSKESVESDSNRFKINSPKTVAEKKEDIIAVDPSLEEEPLIDLHV